MNKPSGTWPMLCVIAPVLAACAAGSVEAGTQRHLSATQCSDLTAIRGGFPITRGSNMSELAALEQAGYHPEWSLDPFYPADLEAAQRQVSIWYEVDCRQDAGVE